MACTPDRRKGDDTGEGLEPDLRFVKRRCKDGFFTRVIRGEGDVPVGDLECSSYSSIWFTIDTANGRERSAIGSRFVISASEGKGTGLLVSVGGSGRLELSAILGEEKASKDGNGFSGAAPGTCGREGSSDMVDGVAKESADDVSARGE